MTCSSSSSSWSIDTTANSVRPCEAPQQPQMWRPTNDAGGVAGSVRRFWRRSYASDYVGLALLFAAYLGAQFFVEPFHRMFTLDDHAKQYPHALVQRVSNLENIIYAGVGPLVFIIMWSLVFRPGLHKTHVTIFGLLVSLFLSSLLTDIIKNAVGRPRPDLIARCKPQPGTPEHELVTISVCTETNHHRLHDGWRSFPSGHSSWAFSGLGYLALFLAGQLRIFRPHADLSRVLMVMAPLVGASLIAMSRLADYRHDVFDVTCGSLLGMLVAYFSYRRYYRPLNHPKCDVPYPSPAESEAAKIAKSRDVESQVHPDFDLDDMSDDEVQTYPLTHARSPETGGRSEPP
ncbi:Diacylglycerol pyrophosphate phosphatase 1 [Exophiala dermatitidis]